ncbi:reverse transcriptase (RNA-dependent DNA polymerase) [Hirsutella rhossiliensis]|uniref:Reverse transcriptase (RNA-dependent DNA polymerase) domain-containing protein n=1 Tax=Hirsutella rhossiliensis TaxID=111463 RepID=A0A9P8MV74_9HYPO|nr:reverse transcriptase (RNA-dependent DNA polymerase) domain-containing protein [Hirsutella rhossiliensis]KAH0962012.1 reverse transcriptase (RNA-dependent DNA polymerase) domain-containing protein [Hirsutella rhossiliensis]
MNKDWWNSEQQRMGYAVSCLKAKAHDQVSYNIKDGMVLFDSVNAIKAVLQSAFGDIDAKATAQRKIFDMRQGHRSLTVFLPEWYATAKLTEWDSEALIAHLRRALHDDITWRLSLTKSKDTPTDLTQFMDLVRTCDSECRQLDANYFKKENASGSTKHGGRVPAPAVTPLTTPNDSGDSMDLSAITWGAEDVASGRRPKTDAERAARKAYCTKHGLCHWCIDDKSTSIKTNAMLDSGATGKGFVDESFAHDHKFTLHKLRNRRRLNVVDGRPSSAGDITHLGKYDIILGKPWLTDHNPIINWSTNMVSFNSDHCRRRCMEKGQYQLAVFGASPLAISTTTTTLPPPPIPRRVGAAAFYMLAEKRDVDVFSLSLYEIDKRLAELGVITEASTFVEPKAPRFGQALTDLQKMNRELERQDGMVAHLPESQQAHELQARRKTAADMYLSGASLEDIHKALEPKTLSEADKLPPHRGCDHEIQLQPGTTPPHGPLYGMSEDELVVLRKFLQENLDKGFIRASTSPAASPVLFAKKPGGGLRFCVDYRGLNAITIKNRYPLPLIQETLSQLSQARFCTAYIDDILIYSNDLASHRLHVKSVLQALEAAGLQLDVRKCEFETTEVKYLGMIISTTGEAFDALKSSFTSAPILRHFDPAKEVFVECDASDFVSSGILSQEDDQGVLHPVAFMSKKYDPAECNYEIYDKELLAILRCFECWRPELQGAHHQITVVRWSEFLSQFQFAIKSIPGKENGKPDALTRRSQDLPQNETDDRIRYQQQSLLKPHNIDRSVQEQLKLDPELAELFANLCWEQEISLCPITRLLDKGYEDDEWWMKIRDEMLKPHGTENANAFLEQYLRQYVSFAQDNWDEWLPLAEFAARNVVNDSTGMSPFFANTGYHPRMSFGPPRPIPRAAPKDLAERGSEGNSFAIKMQEITDLLRTNLASAQASQEQFANANRTPAPAYRVGDMVLLSTRNIRSARPIPKLDHKFIGPFRVERVLNAHAYQLKLPHELQSLHNSFHTNLLRPAPNDPLPGQYNPTPPPIALDANGEKLWAIEAILDSKRTRQNGFQYHVQWRGYDLEEATWEPLHNVVNAHIAIKEFEKLHRTKPRPTKQEMRNAHRQAARGVVESEAVD